MASVEITQLTVEGKLKFIAGNLLGFCCIIEVQNNVEPLKYLGMVQRYSK